MELEHWVKEKGKWAQIQIGSRPNHCFDCEAMQTAAVTMIKLIGREAVNEDAADAGRSAGAASNNTVARCNVRRVMAVSR